jgi:hypothetical protein
LGYKLRTLLGVRKANTGGSNARLMCEARMHLACSWVAYVTYCTWKTPHCELLTANTMNLHLRYIASHPDASNPRVTDPKQGLNILVARGVSVSRRVFDCFHAEWTRKYMNCLPDSSLACEGI